MLKDFQKYSSKQELRVEIREEEEFVKSQCWESISATFEVCVLMLWFRNTFRISARKVLKSINSHRILQKYGGKPLQKIRFSKLHLHRVLKHVMYSLTGRLKSELEIIDESYWTSEVGYTFSPQRWAWHENVFSAISFFAPRGLDVPQP